MNNFFSFIKAHKDKVILYTVFAVGVVACCFTRLIFNIFFFALIFPGCMLYFVRKSSIKLGLPLAAAGLLLGCSVSVFTICGESNPLLNFLSSVLLAIITLIPYLLDKLVYTRFFHNQLAISFMFPLTWITLEVILELTPLGTLISIGYVTMFVLPLIQVVSLFGMYFISFIILFLNSALVTFILSGKKEKKGLIIAVSLFAFSLIYSGIYLVCPLTSNQTVTVSTGYSTNDDDYDTRIKLSIEENKKWFLKDAKFAGDNKAQLLVYPEEAFYLYEDEVQSFQTYCLEQSKMNNIYTVVGIEISNVEKTRYKNQIWVLGNDGELKAIYKKSHYVPVDEDKYVKEGDGKIPLVETPFGKLSVVICMDNEFQSYVTQVGRMGADILVVPSWFWKETTKNVLYNDTYRAIENGVNLIKITEERYSYACNYRGEVVCEYSNTMDWSTKQDHHIFNLPTKGIKTIYPYLGLFFNYVYIVALAGIIVFAAIDSKKSKTLSK